MVIVGARGSSPGPIDLLGPIKKLKLILVATASLEGALTTRTARGSLEGVLPVRTVSGSPVGVPCVWTGIHKGEHPMRPNLAVLASWNDEQDVVLGEKAGWGL